MSEHVLFITPHAFRAQQNGGIKYVTFMLRKLVEQGSCVTVLAPQGSVLSEIDARCDVKLVTFRSRRPFHHFFNMSFVKLFFSQVKRNKPSRVYLNYPYQFPMVFWVCCFFKIPVTLMTQNLEFLRFRDLGHRAVSAFLFWVEFIAVKKCDELWAISNHVNSELQRFFDRQAQVFPYMPDSSQFFPVSESERNELKKSLFNGSDPCVFFFGDLTYRPNRDAFMYINQTLARQLQWKIPRLRFYIAGEGAPDVPLCDNVTVLGYVDRIEPYLQSADLIVLPVDRGGGMSIKLAEAAACGRPILASEFLAGRFDGPYESQKLSFSKTTNFSDAICFFFKTGLLSS